MKKAIYGLMVMAGLGLAACNTDPDTDLEAGAEVEAVGGEVGAEIEAELNQFDQAVTELQAKVASLPEDAREDVNDALEEAGDEREDIIALRDNYAAAQTDEERAEIRYKLREEYRDLHALIVEARMEAAESRDDFRMVVNDEMTDLDREIAELRNEAANLDENARAALDNEIAEMERQREAFQQDLQRLENASEEEWREMRRDLVAGWEKVENSFQAINWPRDVDVDVQY